MHKFTQHNWLASLLIVPLLLLFWQITPSQEISNISVENVNQIQVLNSIKLAPVHQLTWSRDEKHLAVATQDGVWLYNVADGSTIQIGEKEIADDVVFLGDTTQLAINYINRAVIFDTETFKLTRQLTSRFNAINHDGSVYGVIKADSIRLFSTLDDALLNQISIKLIEPCDFACTIQDIAFSTDDKFVVFSSGVPEVQNGIVEIETGKRLSLIDLGVSGLGFNPKGSIIVSRMGELGYLSRSVEFTDSMTGQLVAAFNVFGTYYPPIFNADGRLVVVTAIDDNAPNPDVASGKVYFFDMDKMKKGENLEPSLAILSDTFSTWIIAAQFSPSSTYLALGDKSGNLYLMGLE